MTAHKINICCRVSPVCFRAWYSCVTQRPWHVSRKCSSAEVSHKHAHVFALAAIQVPESPQFDHGRDAAVASLEPSGVVFGRWFRWWCCRSVHLPCAARKQVHTADFSQTCAGEFAKAGHLGSARRVRGCGRQKGRRRKKRHER